MLIHFSFNPGNIFKSEKVELDRSYAEYTLEVKSLYNNV